MVKIGQEVVYVVENGSWMECPDAEDFFYHTGHIREWGRVMSSGDGFVVIWPDDGPCPAFIPAEDVFDARDDARVRERVAQRNLESFGYPEGRSAAERSAAAARSDTPATPGG